MFALKYLVKNSAFLHTVVKGETPQVIADLYMKRFDLKNKGLLITPDDILKANPGLQASKMQIGQKIKIPDPKRAPLVDYPQYVNEGAEIDERSLSPRELELIINVVAETHNIPPDIFRGFVAVESKGDPEALSSAGARGMTQLMPQTISRMGLHEESVNDLYRNLQGGAIWLNNAKEELQPYLPAGRDPWKYALMAYHAGAPAVVAWIKAGEPAAGLGNVGKYTLEYPNAVHRESYNSDALIKFLDYHARIK